MSTFLSSAYSIYIHISHYINLIQLSIYSIYWIVYIVIYKYECKIELNNKLFYIKRQSLHFFLSTLPNVHPAIRSLIIVRFREEVY